MSTNKLSAKWVWSDDQKHSSPIAALTAALRSGTEPVWIFAYGSLIWDPDFHFAEAAPALLHGYHRRCCLYSFDYRGSRTQPGLVLGLDRGGSCRGIAFRLVSEEIARSVERLWRREMSEPAVYELRRLPVRTQRGRQNALAFTVRRDRPDYAGQLPLDEAARIVAQARGRRGSCRDYLEKTLACLVAHGIFDARLQQLVERVSAITPSGRTRRRRKESALA